MKTLDEVIGFMEERQKTEDWDVRRDALQYLKWYKELADDSEAYVKWRENPPLTWDELKTMEGKPVWVEGAEHPETGAWYLIQKVDALVWLRTSYGDWVTLHKPTHGTGWQAYRKERS